MSQGLSDHPQFFRISADDAGEPLVPFASSAPDDFTLGAFLLNGRLVGAVSFQRETRVKLRHKGLLYRMHVCVDASGERYRQKTRAAIERAASIEGLEQINLTVVANNERARRLYASEGFESFAFQRRSIKSGALYLDEEQMVLRLNR
jgi:cyclohexyl-isocyanide hydratase